MKKVLCGVDIGGTKLSTALVDHDGNIIDKSIIYDHVDKPEDLFVEQVSLNIKTLFKKTRLKKKMSLVLVWDVPATLDSGMVS